MPDIVARLRSQILDPLRSRFVERGEVVDLIALALVAGEHLFLYGPPGTAKSALIRQFASSVRGNYFEYLLTRFSEPSELFGPVDIARLREGIVATVITGMLPEAEFAFLDELFNANSAILNNLLTVLNESLPPGRGDAPSPALVALQRVESPPRGRNAPGAVRSLPAAMPRGRPPAFGDSGAAPGGMGARAVLAAGGRLHGG